MIRKINDHCEAFDWAFGIWYWLSHWHDGQFGARYAAMCQITEQYKLRNIPSIDFDSEAVYGDDDFDEDNEGAIMVYHEINEENWEEFVDEFCRYMDDDWEKDAC